MEKKYYLVLICTFLVLQFTPSDSLFHHHRIQDLFRQQRDSTELFQDIEFFEHQRLDHFDPTNLKTWKQKYFITMDSFDYHNQSSSIFLLLGGEGALSPFGPASYQAYADAVTFKAGVIELEHRYYGDSRPTANMSVDNLRYLTSEQALQDAANFIEFFNEKYNISSTTKWIVFGGSYSGSLAAWFRAKYPHLVEGAIASSAPVQAIVDFSAYLEVVQTSIGPKCSSQIKLAIEQFTNLLNDSTQWKQLDSLFKLCDPLDGNNQNDVYSLVGSMVDTVAGQAQYHNIFGYNIHRICDPMNSAKPDSALETLASLVTSQLEKSKCLDYKYDKAVKQLLSVDFDNDNADGRAWIYQTCTEFGYYQSTSSSAQPFSSYQPLEFELQLCGDVYRKLFNSNFVTNAVDFTNNIYGAKNLSATNILLVNGLIDPWHKLGITQDINPSSKALVIPDSAHCASMMMEDSTDTQDVKDARETIRQTIRKFLAN